MGHFSTLRKIFSTKRKKDEERKEADSRDIHSTHPDARCRKESSPRQEEESSGTDDPYAALTEVASPEPVQDRDEGRLSRRRSLEDQYEANKEHARHHQDGEDIDPFENLSEVASPEPIQDRDEGRRLRRRISLEDRLESLERRRSRSSTR
ncbi:hypothetical protein Plec18167_004055 [Paecilomyces lecythidis]|uniref:Uncharacterized protein n=1 Tax=Paecilomyces lecythidis TaxID=3004212 RepID=A0ABR3XUC3_9EURO